MNEDYWFSWTIIKAVLPLMKIVLTLIARNVLLLLRVMTATLATAAATQKKIYGSGMTTLMISNEEIKDIKEIVKSFG